MVPLVCWRNDGYSLQVQRHFDRFPAHFWPPETRRAWKSARWQPAHAVSDHVQHSCLFMSNLRNCEAVWISLVHPQQHVSRGHEELLLGRYLHFAKVASVSEARGPRRYCVNSVTYLLVQWTLFSTGNYRAISGQVDNNELKSFGLSWDHRMLR